MAQLHSKAGVCIYGRQVHIRQCAPVVGPQISLYDQALAGPQPTNSLPTLHSEFEMLSAAETFHQKITVHCQEQEHSYCACCTQLWLFESSKETPSASLIASSVAVPNFQTLFEMIQDMHPSCLCQSKLLKAGGEYLRPDNVPTEIIVELIAVGVLLERLVQVELARGDMA